MSASLVGSEMCIRDSFRRAAHPWRRRRWRVWGPPPAGRLACRAASRRGCLLYTSDAADDM
eukprot:13290345-Alexandrium_andersonii.AAC.1